MAAVVERVLTGSTANVNNYASAAFTPTTGDLLFVFSHATGSIDSAPACVASANGITFTRIARLEHTLSGNVSAVFVADQLVGASPVSMTVTVQHPTDAATGCFVMCGAVTGMTKVGTAAVLQHKEAANLGANTAYTVTFDSAPLTTNPLAGFIAHAGGAAINPPTSWSEVSEPADQATPASGFEWARVDSGVTSTSHTWTRTDGLSPGSNTRANVAAIEFDASTGAAAAIPPILVMPPRI